MNFQSVPLDATAETVDLDAFVAEQQAKDQLRFILCGSVDDGKSTLLGRLLYDSKSVYDDQLDAAAVESERYGTQAQNTDLALLVDGLQAEREQGITIDVAYRFFETPTRKFIAADTPGHEQYTRNMATGASTAQAAVVLVDATKGLSPQTKRHSAIINLMGIEQVIVAVNKMDLVGHSIARFVEIEAEYRTFAKELGIPKVVVLPVSALSGENVFETGQEMDWFEGPTLIQALEQVDVTSNDEADAGVLMPVQLVVRPSSDFRGYCGTLARGTVQVGDEICAALSGKKTHIKSIQGPNGEIDRAIAGQAVTVQFEDELDVSRGDILCAVKSKVHVADQFAARVIWMSEKPMLPNRSYAIRFATASAKATITDLVYELDINTLAHTAAKQLDANGIAYCKLSVDQAVAFCPYSENRECGGFILVDRITNATVAAGMIDHPLRRASNIAWHDMKVDKDARAAANGQKACLVWFTGFSGSGKSTIADCLEQKLFALGHRTYLLDGDNVRHGLNRDLGFTDADRVENIRRVGEVAKLMVDAGLIVLASFISPFASERQMVRSLMEEGEFVEVFVNTPLDVCEERDPKGLYKKARSGQLKNFTGIDSEYQAPKTPEIELRSANQDADVLADEILEYLQSLR